MTIESFLLHLVQKWEPTQKQWETAAGSQNYLRDLLRESRIPIIDSYLTGSYARGTALRPIDDVDIVFLVESTHWTAFPFLQPNPEDVLASFARAIRRRYLLSSVYTQRRSVNLRLSDLDVDVVPALLAGHASTAIYVPDRNRGEWILSNPKEHACRASEVNKTHSNLFKPLVKLLKIWNSSLPSTATLKSFLIETMAVHLFSNYSMSSLQDGMTRFWDHVAFVAGAATVYKWRPVGISASWLGGVVVPDMGRTGANVAEKLDWERWKKFVKAAIGARERALLSLRARTEDNAIQYWKDNFLA